MPVEEMGVAALGLPDQGNLIAWFDPTMVTVVGGKVTAAVNRAAGAPGNFTQTTAAWRPTYTATGLNGFPGMRAGHLNGPINGPSGTRATTPLTMIIALAAASDIGETICAETASSLDGNNSAYAPTVASTNRTFFIDRFDSAGADDAQETVAISTSLTVPCVVTWIWDPVNGYIIRRNGVALGGLTTYTGGSVDKQDTVGVGGQTDAQTIAYGVDDFQGTIGTMLVFAEALSAAKAAAWEGFVRSTVGL